MILLTAQEIVDGLIKSGGVLLWSIDLGIQQPALSAAITLWRNSASDRERQEVARALAAASLDQRTIGGVTRWSARRQAQGPMPAPPSRTELREDAAHIAAWGYV